MCEKSLNTTLNTINTIICHAVEFNSYIIMMDKFDLIIMTSDIHAFATK